MCIRHQCGLMLCIRHQCGSIWLNAVHVSIWLNAVDPRFNDVHLAPVWFNAVHPGADLKSHCRSHNEGGAEESARKDLFIYKAI